MDVTPDYDNYSLDDLYSAAAGINREQYPQRAALLQQLIAKREAELAALRQQAAATVQSDTTDIEPRIPANLAKRSHRFWGAIIDAVLQVLLTIPLVWYVGIDAFAAPTLGLTLGSLLYGIAAYLLLHGYLLYRYGQTIGKAEFGMRIEYLNGQQASLQHVLLLRYFPMLGINLIPVVGAFIVGLLNPLMIFGKQKRCLHDRIAKTRVCYVSQPAKEAEGMAA